VCPDHAARRGGPFARLPSVNGVPEVLDTATGLVWRRCAEGQAWTGSTCGGTPVTLTWQAALDHAKQQASATHGLAAAQHQGVVQSGGPPAHLAGAGSGGVSGGDLGQLPELHHDALGQ
jgi:hypothetical protein